MQRRSSSILRSAPLLAAALATLIAAGGSALRAHQFPSDVALQVWVRPQGNVLTVLVRAPLEAMQDVTFPTTGPGYLDFERLREGRQLDEAASRWIGEGLRFREDDAPLPYPQVVTTRVSLPSDRSFGDFDQAMRHLRAPPLPATTEIVWQQALLDVLLEVPIASDGSRFSVEPTHARLGLRVVTALRFLPPGGGVRAFSYRGDPGVVHLDPRWYQAAWRFVEAGFLHILDGTDHLLFLVCLVLPFRRLRPLLMLVTAFTVAHSVTLFAAAYGLAPDALWFPALVETLIAASILYMALENIAGPDVRRRWLLTFAFGLVHGFGFSFALRETLQFAGSHLLTSLVSFNLGVEAGQILVLVLLVPALGLLFRRVVEERMGTILLSALVAHTSWHWMSERADVLARYRLADRLLEPALLAAALPWTLLALIAGALGWAVLRARRKASAPAPTLIEDA